ncbi:S8 family serine peptidase [Bradyrhizobium sp. 1]|uniref:S8 family serine peptidase n=1 Tax=Bradyrhizobium sp. 1 TaxID=241591 RepID=UPI001FF94274|nr:S8 family serine peptidase [Bradyrhizobium sp. 1]MCK1396234.1 S8 family serine peptidase [Bradyrhizobium sp. 1]
MAFGIDDASPAFAVAVIDGPYDQAALSNVLARAPLRLAGGSCDTSPKGACDHGTFIMGVLGARPDAPVPGLCPSGRLLHLPLFADTNAAFAGVTGLAAAIAQAADAGARLINLSLAIMDEGAAINRRLAAALDFAHTRGCILVAAAGNQGRPTSGQLLTHPAVIPVVAVDALQRLLPDSNFGPALARRGVAALGQMPGYAPGGGLTTMSGTSVATAVATGMLAQLWSARRNLDAATLRSALARLGPRDGAVPPILNRAIVAAALDRATPATIPAARGAETAPTAPKSSHVSLQGATSMEYGNGRPFPVEASGMIAPPAAPAVTPAGCSCGGGQADDESALSGFVYAIGTVDAVYPNLAIEREMLALSKALRIPFPARRAPNIAPTEDRLWQHAVLSADRKLTRYLARQLRWRLTIEELPVFVLQPNDAGFYDDLIDALNRPLHEAPPAPTPPPPARGRQRAGRKARETASEIARDIEATRSPLGPVEDLDVVVGALGPRTADGTVVAIDQLFQTTPALLAPASLIGLPQLADNHGLTDGERACNFLAARCRLGLPVKSGYNLSGARVMPSRLGAGFGRIVRVIFTYSNASGAIEEHFVRVDVTHEFPMIVSELQPYLERGERT